MRTRIFIVISLLVTGALASGCASATQETNRTERVCVRISQINSYGVIDDHHVFVNVTGKDEYLLTLDHGCPGLLFARGISISEQSTRVCGDGSGLLTFVQPGVGDRRCRIIGIDRVADRTTAEALVEARRANE